MPLSKYDKAFGGGKGAARKAYTAMVEKHGEKEGERRFYATANTRGKTASTGRTRRAR